MNILVDIIIVAIPIVAIIWGYRRGFAKTAVHLIGMVLAVIVALAISPKAAEAVFDLGIAEGLKESIVSEVPELDTASVEEGVQAAVDGLPDFLSTFVQQQEWDPVKAVQHVTASLEAGEASVQERIAETIVTQIIRPLCLPLLSLICFLILWIVLTIVVRILAHVTNGIFKLPVLKTLNQTAGAIVGGVFGVILMLVAVMALQAFAGAATEQDWWNRQVLDSTLVTRFLSENNPLAWGVGYVKDQLGQFLA